MAKKIEINDDSNVKVRWCNFTREKKKDNLHYTYKG